MTVHYIKNAIGSAAYRAMAQNCGVLSFTPTTWNASVEKTNLDASVAKVLAACLANSTISVLGDDSAGSLNAMVMKAATYSALANVNVPPTALSTSTLLVDLAVNIATLFTAWVSVISTQAGGTTNYIQNAVGAAAFEALSVNKGLSSGVGTVIETDLGDQVIAIMAACHANSILLGLEPSTEGSQDVQAVYAATISVLSNLGTDGLSASDLTNLASVIEERYGQAQTGCGLSTNFCQGAAGSYAFSAMGINRGLSSTSIGLPTILLDSVTGYLHACENNSTFSGYGNSTAGSTLVVSIEAASNILLQGLDTESITNLASPTVPTTALTAAAAMAVALITEINTAIT